MASENYALRILVHPMIQQIDLRCPADDWTGTSNAVERRRRQNRLHQRAYRRKKKCARTSRDSSDCELVMFDANHTSDTRHGGSEAQYNDVHRRQKPLEVNGDTLGRKFCRLNNPATWQRLQHFYERANAEYISGSPRLDNLPILLGINILIALAGNADVLEMPGLWLDYEAVSPFCRKMTSRAHSPEFWTATATGTPPIEVPCPQNLQPTKLQTSVIHHPWIDLFPLPRLRDNILRAIERDDGFDEDELCYDVVDVDCDSQSGKASLITWGTQPWDVRSWEVTPAFIRKWGRLLDGCEELIKATNYWREYRGERLINLPTLGTVLVKR